jgi:hypothetical protein
MNNPAITAISLTTFLIAYPKSSPPKNPPPKVAETEVIISVLRLRPPVDTILEHGCTWCIYGISSI